MSQRKESVAKKRRERESEKTKGDEQQRESGRKVREAMTRYERNLLETKKGKGVPKIFLWRTTERGVQKSGKGNEESWKKVRVRESVSVGGISSVSSSVV